MAAWKYIKGSEKDFEGAPEWATHRMFNDTEGEKSPYNQAFTSGIEKGDSWESCNGDNLEGRIEHPQWWYIIAQRERVTSINDDRLAQEMRPRSIVKPDGSIDFGCIQAPLVTNNTDALITERGTRYGKFKDGAEIMRDLKHVMHEVDGWNNLTPSQKEALDMIQHKIGRILNGDPTYDDSWKDIAGYATLIVEELNGAGK